MDFEKMARDAVGGRHIDDGTTQQHDAFVRGIADTLRAAFAAGREAMREEAAKVADEVEATSRKYFDRGGLGAAANISAAIRALPGKEG
jgi:hypothetical protein